VRDALCRMAFSYMQAEGGRIAGIGRFRSHISDLGSNKKHLKGFGR
jgi:hypothetical protein